MAKRKKDDRVSKKISTLRHEGIKQDQAVATALSMKRSGRLSKSGGYIRKKKRSAGRSSGRY